uniref:Uncharacterized protein n=1 Tax=Arundo donax TaxID=35708 RepID=A0A0A9B1P8_ARUDO
MWARARLGKSSSSARIGSLVICQL